MPDPQTEASNPTPSIPPGLVATVGLHASASTWVYNVVRELLIASAGAERVCAFYADSLPEFPAEELRRGRHCIVKSHHGSTGLDDFLQKHDACLFLSIRDPRDAVLSMMQRFGATPRNAVSWLTHDCERAMRVAGSASAIFRYEKFFFEDPAVIELIGSKLGLRLTQSMIERLLAQYQTESVKVFAQSLALLLPAERLVDTGHGKMDPVTQIHDVHIGDGRIGKWRDLASSRGEYLTHTFGPFLRYFGYSA